MTSPLSTQALFKLLRVDARQVWKNEATEFTPWLLTHIDELNEAIGFEIELVGKEEPVGSFAVDLFGKDVQTGRPAIIENQLEDSDHRHLGQLMTYAAGLKAGLIIWIAPKFRSEHREALKWLNEISAEAVSFFGIELEILEINGHRAPNFKLVAEPNAWQKASSTLAGGATVQATKKMMAYQDFFLLLLNDLKAKVPSITNASKTQPQSWFSFAAGRTGAYFAWSFTNDGRFKVELTVDTDDADQNRSLVSWLWDQRETFGLSDILSKGLELDVSEKRRAQRLVCFAPWPATIDASADALSNLAAWAVPAMAEFVPAIRPRLNKQL